MKAEGVISALKNVPKSKQKGDPKNVTSPGRAQEKGKGVQQTKKRQGERQGQTQEQVEGQRTRYIREQKPDERIWQGKEEIIQGSRLWKRKERRKNWRQDRKKIERSKTFEDPVIQLFSNLMEGATMQDWQSLFDFQNTRRHIYHYNHETRCADQPCRDSAPWPVLWILARFHPRHIWCGKSLPNVVNFKASLNIFCEQNSLEMVFSRQTETAFLNLRPIPWQNQSVHPSCCSISRHVDLEFKTSPHRSFYQEFSHSLP